MQQRAIFAVDGILARARDPANRGKGIVTSAPFTYQTRPASVGSDEQNQ
jgi:hypothetical protein